MEVKKLVDNLLVVFKENVKEDEVKDIKEKYTKTEIKKLNTFIYVFNFIADMVNGAIWVFF